LTDQTPPNDEEAPETEATPTDESGSASAEGRSEEQVTRPDASADVASEETASDQPSDESAGEPEPAPEQPAAAPAAEASEEATGSEGPAEDAGDEVARAPSPPEPEAAEGAPPTSATEPSAETGEEGEEEEFEPTPRQKPEIPGADLEPVFIPQEEEYLDAEAQAAAEAEREAEAERARAEAEDERSKPIADAAIDLAAGARYTATGKRKTAVARVILKPGAGEYAINGKSLEAFFPRETLQRMIRQPLETVGYEARMDVIARMHGGGVSAQAGALRHGISRALIEADPNLRGELKRRGFLTRDPRVKERKKAGLKKARKRPQFSKR
jgi:small subunit ribosomal protein S9